MKKCENGINKKPLQLERFFVALLFTERLKNDDFSAGFFELGSGVIGNVFTNSFKDLGVGGFGQGP